MRITTLFLALCFCLSAAAQEETLPDKLQFHISLGHYPASLAVPTFTTFHPGVNTGATLHWNKNPRHQLLQSANLGYFYHRDLQHAVQLFTEVGYNLKFENGFAIAPLMLGGGYVLSISDLTTLDWNATTQEYEVNKNAVRNNWMISLGTSLSWETNLILLYNRKTTFFVDYRLQVQGVFVKETVPVIAYSPIRVGISFPMQENIKGYMHKKSFFK
jgi:hypothetical protein